MAAAPPHDVDGGAGAQKLVLIVDDEPALRRLLGDLFLSEGYRVSQACNGAEGLDLIRATCPDVVILDLMMPGMSGWTFLDEYQRLQHCPDIPIIAMSAMFDMSRAAPTLRGRGARACLSKPFDINMLLSMVESLR